MNARGRMVWYGIAVPAQQMAKVYVPTVRSYNSRFHPHASDCETREQRAFSSRNSTCKICRGGPVRKVVLANARQGTTA